MNIAVIGTGEWGRNHVRILCEILGPEHVKVADIDENRLKLVKEKYGVETTTNYTHLLQRPEIDAVHVCTPSSTHYEMCKEILFAEKDVLCEKPMAMDSHSCLDLIKLADENRRILMVGHIFRFNSLTNELKNVIESGKLGKIFFIQSERLGLRTPRSDCGVLFDFAIHDIDTVCYLNERSHPEEITAITGVYLQHSVEDFGMLALKFSNDALAHIVVSWLTPQKVRQLTVVGKERSASVDFVTSKMKIHDIGIIPQYHSFNQFNLVAKQGLTYEVKTSSEEPLKTEIQHFIDCVHHRKPPITDGLVGMKAVQIIEAAYESARINRTVKIANGI